MFVSVIDLSISEHSMFFSELISLCEADDNLLVKYACYKGVNLVPLRKSGLRALAASYYIQETDSNLNLGDKIFNVLYKALEKPDAELQQVIVFTFCF